MINGLIEGFGSYPGIKRSQIYLHKAGICQRTGILGLFQAQISLNSDSQSLKTNFFTVIIITWDCEYIMYLGFFSDHNIYNYYYMTISTFFHYWS